MRRLKIWIGRKELMMKRYKKITSIVVVLVMLFVGMAYKPATDVKASIPATPTEWTTATGVSGTYAYNIYEQTLDGFDHLNFFIGSAEGQTADLMGVIGTASSKMDTATVKVDDVVQTVSGSGFCIEKVAAVTNFNLEKMSDKTIYYIEITGDGGSIKFFVKKGSAVQPSSVTAAPISGVPGAANVGWTVTGAPATQKYNIYLDGELFRSGVTKNPITVNNLPTGTHDIGVSGVWGEETDITETTVTISSTVMYSTKLTVEGFQIRSNYGTEESGDTVAYRTLCKAPKAGSKIVVGGQEYEVAQFGTSYAIDPNNTTGDNDNNTIDASYTLLDPTTYSGHQWTYKGLSTRTVGGNNVTYGYIANGDAIIDDWKESDTDNTYYAFTMDNITLEAGMTNTLFIRPFIVTTSGNIIYGKTTAYTSVAEIADVLYTNSMSKNSTAHKYLYDHICHAISSSNAHYKANEVQFGWNGNLYIGFRLIPDSWTGSTHDEMQYVKIGDYFVHSSSYFTGETDKVPGSQGSYKGFTNEELAVRVEQPGKAMWYDEYQDWYNWGIQIKYPNKIAYARLEDRKVYNLVVRYKSTNAGTMWMKREGPHVDGGDGVTTPYEGGDDQPLPYTATAGYNEIKVKFRYLDWYKTISNDPSIVFSLGGGHGEDSTGFPKGTIISDLDISFEELD